MFTFLEMLQWSCLKAVSVPTFVIGDLRDSGATSGSFDQEPGVDREFMHAQRSKKCVCDVTKLYDCAISRRAAIYYRKRRSASYIVREVLSVSEGEREREREREIDR